MKKSWLLLLVCLFATAVFAQDKLKGQVKNAKSGFVLVEKPYDGKYLPNRPLRVEINRSGKFEIDLADASEGFLLLRIDGEKIRAYAQPSSEDDAFEADMKDLAGTLRFSGPNAAANNFLQTLPRLDLRDGKKLSEVYNPFFTKGDSPKDAWTTVTDYLESEKKLLKKAAKEGGFSSGFTKAVEQDISAYYHAIFGSVAYRHWLDARNSRGPYRFDSGWSNYWKKMTGPDCLDNLPAAVSEWYLVFLEQYVREYRLDFLKESEFADADTERGEQFLEYDRLIWKYFKPDVREYASAGIYAAAALLGKREPILVELSEKFSQDFPDSRYAPLLSDLIGSPNEPGASGGAPEEPLPTLGSNIQVLDGEISSMKDLLSNFRGKVVYMDIWATWCSPCMFEFSHHEPLERFAKGKDIVLLYVSVDNDDKLAKVQKVIQDKNLTGYHLLANLSLRDELINLYGDGQNLALPTYLIFDKKGKLAVRDAKQPSHNTLLFNQLSEVLR